MNESEEIPEEYWPRCDWCGEFLGDCSVKVKRYASNPRHLCENCYDAVASIINELAPFIVRDSLSKHADLPIEDVKMLGIDEVASIAKQRMIEAERG